MKPLSLTAAVMATLGAGSAIPVARAAEEPLQLRSNVMGISAPGTGAGLVALEMDSSMRSWLTAEAMVWVGAGNEGEADAMVIVVHMRDPKNRGEARIGRFVVIAGAVRPVHLDGGAVKIRLPWKINVEGFGGVPVQPAFGANSWDWVIGTRAARQLGDWGSVGAAYLQRRSSGRLDASEIGLDVGGAPLRWLDGGGTLAWDLINPGVSAARFSVAARRGPWRIEAFASHLSPSRLLPATSLFSVLGDTPSEHLGTAVRWRAAPRLDLGGTLGMRRAGDDVSPEVRVSARLRLDDRGEGAVGVDVRRDGLRDDKWTGVRLTATRALPKKLSAAAELELVVPDDPRGRGEVWPWGLVALGWRPARLWDVAVAVEARASPEDVVRVDGLVRLTRQWGTP